MTLSGLTIVSRISGFLRDIILASALGTGPLADAFFIAFRLPNFFRRLFAEGAMNAAFVPTFSYLLDRQGKMEAQVCAEQVLAFLLSALVGLVVVTELLLPFLMHIIAPGYQSSSSLFVLTIDLSRIVFPYILFISLAALLTGILNAFNRFAVGAASPVLLNVFMIIALLFFSETLPMPSGGQSW
jgi:putative peptidoglycan lipid II flippase